MRGQITEQIRHHELGKEITASEIKLIPYIMDCIHNSRQLDRSKLSREENRILNTWYDKKLIDIDRSTNQIYINVSEEFYDFMALVMKHSYAKTRIY